MELLKIAFVYMKNNKIIKKAEFETHFHNLPTNIYREFHNTLK